ncbi:hypothetical protein ACF0H5_020652 [Mactra antiquata]
MANIEDLDDEFILCTVCNTEYDENQRAPKLLPCLHTVCNDCALNSARGSILKCAVCQEEHSIGSDLNFLKDNTMKNMMDMIKLQRKPSSILCSDCPDSNNGDVFCKDCYVFLCKECTSAHKRTQLTRRHVLLSLEELKSAGIGSFTRKEMCSIPGHEDQPFSFYCENEECQKPVCTQCVVNDHSQANGHAIRSLNDTYEETKVHVERLVGELLGKISEVSSEAKGLESETSVIDKTRDDVVKQIDSLFDAMETALKTRREKLKQRVEVISEERKKNVDEQLEQLQKNKSDMENACNYSSRMLVFTNKPEFLQLRGVVVSKLTDLVNIQHGEAKPEPMELNFDKCIDTDRFEEIVKSIGEVRTNVYGDEDNRSKVNHGSEGQGQYVLPYKGSPKTPPGKFMAGKYPEMRTKDTKQPAKVESLKLDLKAVEARNSNKGAPKSSPPSNEAILGRPLALKSPVITPNKQPTSLGDFLNELQTKSKLFYNNRVDDNEAQDGNDIPKSPTPSPSTASPVGKYPGTPPYTPPVYAAQPQMMNVSRNQPYNDMTSSSKKEMTSPSVNGVNPYIQNVSEVKQASPRKVASDKPVVFGDISCPDFQLDGTSAHHEREVSSDGRTLRNKKTDIYGGSTIDLDNSLVQYKGAIGTHPFQDPGKYYYEVDVVYNIQQPLEETWLVFEIGLCRLDDVDLHHTVERHENARSFYVARYPEDGKLTQEFWHNRDLLSFSPLSDNTAGIEVRITYGLLVDTRRKKWIISDCNNNKVLHTFDSLDFSEALYPVFGCYNPDLCTVEMTLKTGSEITIIPQCLKAPGYRSP